MKKYRPYNRSRVLFLFAGTLVMIAVMAKTGATLKTPATPKGILELEFARNAGQASAVVGAWKGIGTADNIQAAKINTWLDFVFLLFYSTFLYTLCRLLADSFSGFLCITGRFLAKGALVAGLLDTLENAGMLVTLYGHISDDCALLTYILSITKWIIASSAVGYILMAGSVSIHQKIKKTG
ncbi:MAG: hypothetical protein ABI760_19715 [Ferruginibacter sp.]